MKKIIYFIIGILLLNLSLGYDECQSSVNKNELPCSVFLPNNISQTNCATINSTIYYNSTYLSSNFMSNYTNFLCNTTFNESNYGVYSIYFTTGDSAVITLVEDENTIYYFWVMGLLFILFLIWVGYKEQNVWLIVLSGFLAIIMGISIFFNGFPNIYNELLKNAVSVIFIGVGMFLSLAPLVDWFGDN